MEITKNSLRISNKSQSKLNPLLLAVKDRKISSAGDNKFLNNVFGKPTKQPTKKEIERDRKVEALLEAYKK